MKILLSIIAALGISTAAHAASLDVDWESSTNQGAQVGITYDGLAQTFTVGLDGTLDAVALKLSLLDDDETEDATIGIWDTTAGGPNNLLGSWTIGTAGVGFGSAFDWVMVDVSSLGLAVNVGDVLAVSLSSAGEWGWNAGVDAAADYAGGTRYSDGAGGLIAWSEVGNWDFSTKTYVEVNDVPLPGSLPLLGFGAAAFVAIRRKKRAA